MSNERNSRQEINAGDYFNNQRKQLSLADRRPVIRKASDLVGPGISVNAVRLTNFNDQLATFNGYYASDVGAVNAPNITEQFVGTVSSDSIIGGVQTFTGFTSEKIYQRLFRRNPGDPSTLYFGAWKVTFLGVGL